jgi:hypothetical protein
MRSKIVIIGAGWLLAPEAAPGRARGRAPRLAGVKGAPETDVGQVADVRLSGAVAG